MQLQLQRSLLLNRLRPDLGSSMRDTVHAQQQISRSLVDELCFASHITSLADNSMFIIVVVVRLMVVCL